MAEAWLSVLLNLCIQRGSNKRNASVRGGESDSLGWSRLDRDEVGIQGSVARTQWCFLALWSKRLTRGKNIVMLSTSTFHGTFTFSIF